MSSDFDASEFVDDDFQQARKSSNPGPGAGNPFVPGAAGTDAEKAPNREEVDAKVGAVQNKLSELKRAQQELERERAALEEIRRRQLEFTTGRQEVIEQLTRGIGLLEEAEFAARRDAEQMAKSLLELRDSLLKVQGIHEDTWSKENLNVELTRALTIIENARMEWNSSRLKFPLLNSDQPGQAGTTSVPETPLHEAVLQLDFPRLCKMGLALTWPLALVAVLALGALLMVLVLNR